MLGTQWGERQDTVLALWRENVKRPSDLAKVALSENGRINQGVRLSMGKVTPELRTEDSEEPATGEGRAGPGGPGQGRLPAWVQER